jgi:hypothetical protein
MDAKQSIRSGDREGGPRPCPRLEGTLEPPPTPSFCAQPAEADLNAGYFEWPWFGSGHREQKFFKMNDSAQMPCFVRNAAAEKLFANINPWLHNSVARSTMLSARINHQKPSYHRILEFCVSFRRQF